MTNSTPMIKLVVDNTNSEFIDKRFKEYLSEQISAHIKWIVMKDPLCPTTLDCRHELQLIVETLEELAAKSKKLLDTLDGEF